MKEGGDSKPSDQSGDKASDANPTADMDTDTTRPGITDETDINIEIADDAPQPEGDKVTSAETSCAASGEYVEDGEIPGTSSQYSMPPLPPRKDRTIVTEDSQTTGKQQTKPAVDNETKGGDKLTEGSEKAESSSAEEEKILVNVEEAKVEAVTKIGNVKYIYINSNKPTLPP